MNKKIIEKILAEFDKPGGEIRIDYIRGILETLKDSLPDERVSGTTAPFYVNPTIPPYVVNTMPLTPGTNSGTDEGAVMDAEAAAKLKSIKKMADDSITLG